MYLYSFFIKFGVFTSYEMSKGVNRNIHIDVITILSLSLNKN